MKFRKCIFASFVLIAYMAMPIKIAHSQPSVSVSGAPQSDYRSVIFTFLQNDLQSMEGCHYNFFAAKNPKALASLPGKGRSIATFYKPLSNIQIIAGPLPQLSRKFGNPNPKVVRSVKVYFRALLSCPQGSSGMGDIFSISFKTYPKGRLTSVRQLTKSMKYHMKYYQP